MVKLGTWLAGALATCMALPLLAGEVDDFQHSWVRKALRLQERIDRQAPIGEALWPATHNSYNSKAYANAVSYYDPNHVHSIYDQLRMGARGLELDIHSYFNMRGWPWQWRNDILLCHAGGNNVGCSPGDRPFVDGLNEIRRWLDETRNDPEVLLLYLESHLNGGDYDDAQRHIQNILGSDVYQPPGGACQGIPASMSKQAVLNAGKRVLIITDGCKDTAHFNRWVFTGATSESGYPTDNQDKYQRYPSCTSAQFGAADFRRLLVRFNEDRTKIADVFAPKMRIDADVTEGLMRCGANLFGFDMLTPGDGRLARLVWSWDVNEPNNWGGGEHCAENWYNGRYNDASCGQAKPFACKQLHGDGWLISRSQGRWQDGRLTCSNETGGAYRFAMPATPLENEALKQAKAAAGYASVWVDYTDEGSEGSWRRSQ
ncbi:phospholipase [Chitinimonas prasina]|uniref:Phospholipase n=1 Tax=Chitinimonas prasina TaxID=1434937 RepID=A0ABQ5YBA5_9NEIS|nr:hypothetical protein [Chitinimonas prasina]GLR12069.1 phospholipase [Chitinimonas prasina]